MPRNTTIGQEGLLYYSFHNVFQVKSINLNNRFPMPTLIKVYPFGIPSASGELKLTCPTICGWQAINTSGKQHATVSQKVSWGVSVSLHFTHKVVCNVTLGVVRVYLDPRMLWISQAVYFLYPNMAH
jgi:hypothetical protein